MPCASLRFFRKQVEKTESWKVSAKSDCDLPSGVIATSVGRSHLWHATSLVMEEKQTREVKTQPTENTSRATPSPSCCMPSQFWPSINYRATQKHWSFVCLYDVQTWWTRESGSLKAKLNASLTDDWTGKTFWNSLRPFLKILFTWFRWSFVFFGGLLWVRNVSYTCYGRVSPLGSKHMRRFSILLSTALPWKLKPYNIT